MTKLSPMDYEYEASVLSLVQGKSMSVPTLYTLPPSPLAAVETTTASFDTTIEVTHPELAWVSE